MLDPGLVAEMLAIQAERYSMQVEWDSPFARNARQHYHDYMGGKPDDITVVVAQVIHN